MWPHSGINSPLHTCCLAMLLAKLKWISGCAHVCLGGCSLTAHVLFRRLQAEAKLSQGGGRFEASEAAVFGPFDLFVKRCKKLIELFTTIHQFSTLAQVPCPCLSASAFVLFCMSKAQRHALSVCTTYAPSVLHLCAMDWHSSAAEIMLSTCIAQGF